VLVSFDPLVSFGIGEVRVNDGMQGLVEAGRIVSGELDCCVRYTHHTGQFAAREKLADMYAGRSGIAMPDGCRMVSVMITLDDGDLYRATGEHLTGQQSAFALHRPKISYAPPEREPLYVRRDGFRYELLRAVPQVSPEERPKVLGEQLARFLSSEWTAGRRYTRETLADRRPSMSRDDVRMGLAWLLSCDRLFDEPIIDPATGKVPSRGVRSFLRVRDPSREAKG
jgi:RecA-family ATPase